MEEETRAEEIIHELLCGGFSVDELSDILQACEQAIDEKED